MARNTKNDIIRFKDDYKKLTKKYGLDFFAVIECNSTLLRFIIRLVGEHRIVAMMQIKKK